MKNRHSSSNVELEDQQHLGVMSVSESLPQDLVDLEFSSFPVNISRVPGNVTPWMAENTIYMEEVSCNIMVSLSFRLFWLSLYKVITTMVIRPLNDPT